MKARLCGEWGIITEMLRPTFEKASTVVSSPRALAALAYNVVQTAAWGYCAALLDNGIRWGVFDADVLASRTWPAVGAAVVFAQSIALIEPVLCLAGVIKSNVFTVCMQLLVRNIVLLLAVNRHAELQEHVAVFLFAFAWILSEVIRFPWLTCKVLGTPPPLLSLIRYSLPLVLYPLGGIGEAWTMWRARYVLNEPDVLIRAGGIDVTLTHVVHFLYMPAYLPGFAYLYFNAVKRFQKELRNFYKKKNA